MILHFYAHLQILLSTPPLLTYDGHTPTVDRLVTVSHSTFDMLNPSQLDNRQIEFKPDFDSGENINTDLT